MLRRYTFFYTLALPWISLYLFWRYRRALGSRFWEYFGRINKTQTPGGLWVHAASVGEVNAAMPLLHALRKTYPQLALTVTTQTPTGAARLQQSVGDNIQHVYAPLDYPGAIKRFLAQVNPVTALFIESDLWPNRLAALAEKNIPLVIANARLSPKSCQRYQHFPAFQKLLNQSVTQLLAQSDADAARFAALGLAQDRIHVTGNLKFEVRLDEMGLAKADAFKQQWGADRPVLIAASTHAGEESLLLDVFQALKTQHCPDALLVIAPRHPERFQEVLQLCERTGLHVTQRTRHDPSPQTDIFLLDTLGELSYFYACADLAFIGGTFAKKGGHNLLEAAACGVPVLCGPHCWTIQPVIESLASAAGIFVVATQEALLEKIVSLLGNPVERGAIKSRLIEGMGVHQQSVGRHMAVVAPLVRGMRDH